MTPISARSRSPTRVEVSMLSSSARASSAVEHRRLAASCTTCFGPRTACAGLIGDDLAGDQPVEQHADRGQVLLDGRLGERVACSASI